MLYMVKHGRNAAQIHSKRAQRNSGGARGGTEKTISNHRRVGCWNEITRQHESKDKAATKNEKGKVAKRTGVREHNTEKYERRERAPHCAVLCVEYV